jgi:hypothetical protein
MNEPARSPRAYIRMLVLGAAAAASACEDPLTDPAVIAGPRVVAARVGTQADPGIAEPGPGEPARIEWLALSNEPGAFTAHVTWCNAAPSVIGVPRCDGTIFAQQSVAGTWGEPIGLDFSVPPELAPGSVWLAWLGICALGDATFDASTSRFQCPEGEPLSAFYRGFVPEGTPNRNPSLGDDTLVLDGVTWPATDDPTAMAEPSGAACLGQVLPELRAERPSSFGFELGGDDREAIEDRADTYAAHPRESLVYTHLANLPGLDRAFSAIDYDAERLGFDVPFEFGEEPPGPEGTTLSFILLVRDERGGVDWLQRQACLLPP